MAIDDIDFSWADSVKVQGTPLMKSVAQNSCGSHHTCSDAVDRVLPGWTSRHRSVLTNPKHCITEKDSLTMPSLKQRSIIYS